MCGCLCKPRFSFLWDKCLSTAAGSYGIYMLFKKLPPHFPKVLCRVTFPPAVGSCEVHIPASLWCSQGFPEQFGWVWSHLFTCICLKARDVKHLTWLLVILVGVRWYLTMPLILTFPWWRMVSSHAYGLFTCNFWRHTCSDPLSSL